MPRAVFRDSGHFFHQLSNPAVLGQPYAVSNLRLSITLPLLYTASGAHAVLDVGERTGQPGQPGTTAVVPLHRVPGPGRITKSYKCAWPATCRPRGGV